VQSPPSGARSRAGWSATSLTAEAGIAVFRISFDRWVGGDGEPDLVELMRQSFDELKLLSVRRR
jgi:hypothetical protein